MAAKKTENGASASTALHPLGRLFQQWALDFVIEAVRAVAHDYGKNPDAYRELPDEVGAGLDEFRTKVGVNPEWPRIAERNATYEAQLGEWFWEGSAAFRLAVVTYVEKSSDATRAIAMQAVTGAVDAFRVQLEARGGQGRRSVPATPMFQAAVNLLRSPQLAQVFNEDPAPGDPWPFGGAVDAAGANLIGTIAKKLFPPLGGRMSSYQFLLLQRVADHGARTLSRILDDSPLDAVMEPAYAWSIAARELVPVSTVVTVWRRESQRQALSSIERSMIPPHPAGDVTMAGTELQPAMARMSSLGSFGGFGIGGLAGFGLGFQTHTVGEETCCSTGDLRGGCRTDASCVSVYEHCPTEGLCPTSPGSGLSCDGPCGTGRHHC